MKPRQQRMLAVGLVLVGVAAAAGLTFRAIGENAAFFIEVSEVAAGNYPKNRTIRVGGLVVNDSVVREPGTMNVQFRVTDTRCEVEVHYAKVLPDLFREGQGVVAHGRMNDDGIFVANKILAKHDENYMAPEVAESLAKHVQDKTAAVSDSTAECSPQ